MSYISPNCPSDSKAVRVHTMKLDHIKGVRYDDDLRIQIQPLRFSKPLHQIDYLSLIMEWAVNEVNHPKEKIHMRGRLRIKIDAQK